jgi:hypothetical protein
MTEGQTMNHISNGIPGWFHFVALYSKAVDHIPDGQAAKMVEIGCWMGKSAAYLGVEIINSGKDIELFCVDPWDVSKEWRSSGARAVECLSPEICDADPDFLYREFESNMAPVKNVMKESLHYIREPSPQAARHFADASLDFVLIDGDHEAGAVRDDVLAWMPKVKPTGTLAGDDLGAWPGVRAGLEMAGVWDRVKSMPAEAGNQTWVMHMGDPW